MLLRLLTRILTTTPMNFSLVPELSPNLWQVTVDAHEAAGLDFASWWDFYSRNGYVVNEPDFIMMYGDDIVNNRDAWLVWWMTHNTKDPITRAVQHMDYWRPEVCFCRGSRGSDVLRYYSTDRLLAFTKGSTHYGPV